MEIVCKNRSVRAIVQAFYQDPAHSTNTVVIFMQNWNPYFSSLQKSIAKCLLYGYNQY